MSNFNVHIQFFLDGESYAARMWNHVPRTGDEIMLNAPKGEEGKIACRINRVVWGVEPDNQRDSWQSVNIEISRIPV